MSIILGLFLGAFVYGFFRCVLFGFYTVAPDERAVITSFGRAQRAPGQPTRSGLPTEEDERYHYPSVVVVPPGGPYFKWPWQQVHKVSIATQAVDIIWDPTKSQDTIECVTKDNLTTGVNGQIRFKINENHLYAYMFGVQSPLQHIMGFFVSILRERIANFEDPKGNQLLGAGELQEGPELSEGVSINDLRKNLPLLNDYMEHQCRSAAARYGIELDAALITEIDPPPEVDHALSAINSTRNQVAADISTARADAEQQITMSARAVDIASNNANAEVAPLNVLAQTLAHIKQEGGASAVRAYLRNMRLPLLERARRVFVVSNVVGSQESPPGPTQLTPRKGVAVR